MIDSHCHLTAKDFSADLGAVLERSWAAGLTALVTIGSGDGLEDSKAAVDLTETDARIFAAVGIHPHNADQLGSYRQTITQLVQHDRVVAIGECGLDYHYDEPNHDQQHETFEWQLSLARQHDLPIAIHLRDAAPDLLNILQHNHPPFTGVLHCFCGDKKLAGILLDMGFYLSIPGIVTFRNGHQLREVVKYIPEDRLLLETDCPYLAPTPHRGRRNEPAFIIETAKQVANILNRTVEDVDRLTESNARELFRIPRAT